MGKWETIGKMLGIAAEDAMKLSPEARNALAESKGKVPFSVSATDDGIKLKSPKAKANADFRSPDTIEMMDPEMVPFMEKFNNPVYIESLEADKGYGSKALKQLEESAKKRGADSAYLNASPLGGTRGLSREDAAAKVREFYEKNGYTPAIDQGTNTMMYKKLAGAGAVPTMGLMDGFKEFGDQVAAPLSHGWDNIKSMVAKPLGKQLNITRDPSVSESNADILSTVADPLNLVGGGAGLGLGAIQMLGESRKKKDESEYDQ